MVMASADALLEEFIAAAVEGHDSNLGPYVQGLQRWKAWRDNVPLFYSTCVQCTLPWPSCSVQLYPHLRAQRVAPGLLRHAVLYGTQQLEGDQPVLVLASVAVDDPRRVARLSPQTLQWTAPLTEVCAFPHPAGDLDRIRYCPAAPTLVAVKCANAALSLYDIGPALALLELDDGDGGGDEDGDDPMGRRPPEGGDAETQKGGGGGDGTSAEGGRDAAGSAGTSGRAAGERAGGGGGGGDRPVSVLESPAQEDVSLAWGDSGAGGGGGGGGGSLRLFSGVLGGGVGEYAVREDGTLAEVTVRRGGHDGDATIVDLAWGDSGSVGEAGPSTSTTPGATVGLLASGGTDGRTVLWDPRQRPPALQAPRCRADVNAVAFTPAGGGNGGGAAAAAATATAAGSEALLLANAGNDGVIRVYDIRHLGGGGGAGTSGARAELHRLKGHNCVVRQLCFSPHNRALLGSADEQGRVLLWELGRSAPLEEGLTTRPELLLAHAGHVLPVDDFSWSTEMYGTLASVSGMLAPEVVESVRACSGVEPDLPFQPPAVQVWRPAADLLPPQPGAGAGAVPERGPASRPGRRGGGATAAAAAAGRDVP